jgi:hypothetical protein
VYKPLGDRPPTSALDNTLAVGFAFNSFDAVINQQVTDFHQVVFFREMFGSMFKNELHRIVVPTEYDLGLQALQRWQATLSAEFLTESFGDFLPVRSVFVGGTNGSRLKAIIPETASGELTDVCFNDAPGVLDVSEPVHVISSGLRNVPDGTLLWSLSTQFERCLLGSAELTAH